jgi:hypothetical protein
MPVKQAAKVPEIQLYHSVTGRFPGRPQWALIYRALSQHSFSEVELARCWEAWVARGYRPESLKWLTQWAVSGAITVRGNKPRDRTAEDDLALRRKLIYGR